MTSSGMGWEKEVNIKFPSDSLLNHFCIPHYMSEYEIARRSGGNRKNQKKSVWWIVHSVVLSVFVYTWLIFLVCFHFALSLVSDGPGVAQAHEVTSR